MEKTTQKAIKETLNELNQLDFGLIAHLDSLEVEHDDIVEINDFQMMRLRLLPEIVQDM